MRVLKTTALKKYYGSGHNQVKALDGVDLEVEKGEFVAIVGTSGSGKSTLLHMLGGLDYPTSGKVEVDGRDIFSLKKDALCIFRRRKIGFVFQSYNLVPVLIVYENIVLPIQLDGGNPDEVYIQNVVKLLGLEEKLNNLPSQLSGGQQQRVAIARALMTNPELLLLDEITSALDPMLVGEVLDMVSELKEQGTTILMATHEMSFAHDAADRIVLLRRGVIAENGTPREVMDESQNPETREFFSHFRS